MSEVPQDSWGSAMLGMLIRLGGDDVGFLPDVPAPGRSVGPRTGRKLCPEERGDAKLKEPESFLPLLSSAAKANVSFRYSLATAAWTAAGRATSGLTSRARAPFCT